MMTQPAKRPSDGTVGVTLVSLMNNISVKFGHLNLDVEQAFTDWLHTEGYQAFLEWVKSYEADQ
jgi:hypothetical protein